jgi:integrase
MPERRGKGEGSIRRRADGRWEVRINLGRGLDGKRRQKSVFAESEADAIAELKKLHGRTAAGHVLNSTTPTVATYLEDWYALNSDTWRPSTRRSYRSAIDRYLVKAFGPMRLEQLSPLAIQKWLTAHKTEHGARRRITLAHAVLRSALSEATRLQLVSVNPAELVRVPKPKSRAITPLSIDEATAFLKVAGGHRLGALFSVALACGLRLGEATGLRWDDVDLESGEVRIRQQLQVVNKQLVLQPLKTEKSQRTLVLPNVCIKALRDHRKRQLEERLKAGARWVDTGLVFGTYRTYKDGKGLRRKVGAGLHPRNVLRVLHALLDAAEPKIPRRRFHDLRHSAASLLIAAGVELVEVSKLLGHSDLRITGTLYTHLVKQTATKAARLMDGLLGDASARS